MLNSIKGCLKRFQATDRNKGVMSTFDSLTSEIKDMLENNPSIEAIEEYAKKLNFAIADSSGDLTLDEAENLRLCFNSMRNGCIYLSDSVDHEAIEDVFYSLNKCDELVFRGLSEKDRLIFSGEQGDKASQEAPDGSSLSYE